MKKSKYLSLSNAPLKLLSILTAIILWIVIVNVNDPRISKTISNIPVTILNSDAISNNGKVFEVLENSNVVNITVYGRRSIVEKMSSASFLPTADMSELTFMNTVAIEPNCQVPGIDIQNISCSPATMKISLENEKLQRFVLSIDAGDTKPATGYEIGKTSTDTESVMISGPESIISKLDKAVVKIDATGIKKDQRLDGSLVLYDKNGDEIESSIYDYLVFHNIGSDRLIGVDVHLWEVKQVELEAVATSSIKEGYEIIGYRITPNTIAITGEEEYLEQVDRIVIKIDRDLTQSTKDTSTTVDLTQFLGEGIVLARGESTTAIVETQIGIKDSWSFEIPVVSITTENLDKNLQLTYPAGESILVSVKRKNDSQTHLKQEDVKGSIDLSSLKVGTHQCPVKISLPSDFEVVGEEVFVTVTLAQK